jgi:hypothetical protein
MTPRVSAAKMRPKRPRPATIVSPSTELRSWPAPAEEARERGADLIHLSTDQVPSDERLLGPTTRYILAKCPCRAIVESAGNGANGRLPGPSASGSRNGMGTAGFEPATSRV